MKKLLIMVCLMGILLGVDSISYAMLPPVEPPADNEASSGDLIRDYTNALVRDLTNYTASVKSDGLIQRDITNIIRVLDSATLQKELNSALPASLLVFKPLIDAHDTTQAPVFLTEANRLLQAHAKAIIRVNSKDSQTSYGVQTMNALTYIKAGNPVNDFALDRGVQDAANALALSIGSEVTLVSETTSSKRILTVDSTRIMQSADAVKSRLDLLDSAYRSYLGQYTTARLPRQLTLVLAVPKDKLDFSVHMGMDLKTVLAGHLLDTFSVSVNGAAVSMPVSELSDAHQGIFDFKFRYDKDARDGIAAELKPESLQYAFKTGMTVDLSYSVNGVLKETFSSPIKLSFRIDQFAFEELASADELAIFRYNPSLRIWEAVGGQYDPIAGTLTVNRMSLSQYTVLKTKLVFSDVTNSETKDAVNKLLNKGVLASNATFNPQENITREVFVSWIAEAYGLENRSTSSPFMDILVSNSYKNNILAVFAQGIINGKTGSTFDPKGTITKQEMAKIISNSLVAYNGKIRSQALTEKLLSSRTTVAGWAKDDVALLVSLGLMNESDLKTLDQPVTKEAAATLLSKIYN